jgi:gas vesicle protein
MGRLKQKVKIERLGRAAEDLGETIGTRAKDVGGAIGTRAKDVGGAVGTQVKRVGGTVGTRAKQLQEAAAPKARRVTRELGDQTRKTRRKVGYWIAGEEPPKRRTGLAVVAAGAGAAAAFFLDPANGKRRRTVARDWTTARFRAIGTRGARAGRGIGARAYGLKERVTHNGDGQAPTDDKTLEQKVESELFQEIDIPSRQINIMATNGIVSLRGAVTRHEQIGEIERKVRDITGVRDVENMLHLEGTPAPTSS